MNHWEKIIDHEKKVRIGCASAWNDTATAAKQLVERSTLDYLPYLIFPRRGHHVNIGRSKKKNTEMGYATDFVEQLTTIKPN